MPCYRLLSISFGSADFVLQLIARIKGILPSPPSKHFQTTTKLPQSPPPPG